MLAISRSFIVLALVLVCGHICSGDKRRAIQFFALRTSLSHHNVTAVPLSQSAIQTFVSDLEGGEPSDCSSLTSQYKSTFADDFSRNEDELNAICSLVTRCQTPATLQRLMTEIHGNERSAALDETVVELCPVLLRQAKDPKCRANAMLTSSPGKNSPLVVWGMAFLCVTIISLTSLVGVIIVPFLNKSSYLNVLNLFEGLAVGSLVGSGIFHLIPQAFDLHTSPNKHDHLWKAFMIFIGIYLFYWSERIMNLISNSRNSSQSGDHQLNGDPKVDNEAANEPPATLEQRLRTVSDVIAAGHTHAHEHVHLTDGRKKIATVAWMIIFGDGLHNFIDGLSIGAAFNESILTGISICVAVVCEEFPHELGDFAVLIASGMSVRQAVGFNFLSACTCYLGMVVGICVGNLGPTYIFALAGGMFLYIALVNMMSELTAAVETASKHSVRETMKVLCLQNAGILTGVISLFVLAKYSEYIQFG